MVQWLEKHYQGAAVKQVCQELWKAGHQTLLAGGCVRDALLGKMPQDFDIATSATPEEVEKLFPRALPVGKAFGVMMLPFEGFYLEVATFRTDGEYVDGRRPVGVRFADPRSDAERRDFTVNAMFYDLKTDRVLDFVGGQNDLKARVLRTVGDAERRFSEDKLRLLRAVRFVAQLEFALEERTLKTLMKMAAQVNSVARERVLQEFEKLAISPGRAAGMDLLLKSNLAASLFPRWHQTLQAHLGWQAQWMRNLAEVPKEAAAFWSFWAAPFFRHAQSSGSSAQDSFENEWQGFADDLRLSRRQREEVWHVYQLYLFFTRPARLGEMRRQLLRPATELFFSVLPGLKQFLLETPLAVPMSELQGERQRLAEVGPKPWLNGADLLEMGYAANEFLGTTLQEAFCIQLEGQWQDRDQALAWARSHLKTRST